MDVRTAFEAIVKFLVEEVKKLPVGAEVKYSIEWLGHHNSISLSHERGYLANLYMCEDIESGEDRGWRSIMIHSSDTDEEIMSKLYANDFTGDFKYALVSGWKLYGIKNDIMALITEETDKANALNEERRLEEEAIKNFEV